MLSQDISVKGGMPRVRLRVFKIALEEGLIDRNPVAAVRPNRASSAKKGVFSPEYEYLLELHRSDGPKRPVFPKLFNKPGAGKSGLSMSFKRLMERAGIDEGVARKKDGKLGRNVSRLSFHSLRHSFNPAMANAQTSARLNIKELRKSSHLPSNRCLDTF